MAEMKPENAKPENGVRQTRFRSPNYPVVGLRAALNRAAQLYKKYKRNTVPINLVHKEWEYKEYSGIANQAVAALKSFGLVDVEGKENDRRVRLTEPAYRILLDSSDRAELLKKAALMPPLYAELWKKWEGGEFPNNELINHYLVHDREEGKFNPDTVHGFIANFLDTLRFARLLPDGTMDGCAEEPPAADAEKRDLSVAVGTYVQWTSAGNDMFAVPRVVRGLSSDGQWAFVEGSETGVPVQELTVMETPKPMASAAQPPSNPFFKPAEAPPPSGAEQAEEKKIFDEGVAVLRWPDKLSPESVEDFEYWVEGILRRLRRKAGLKPKKESDE